MTPCCFCLALEKKSRKKKAPVTPPQLLVQDVETTGRQMEDRVAQLLEEELELSGTPPLPASRIFKEELEKSRRGLRPPGGKQNFLWEGSALTGAWALESFYTASLVPPLVPQRPTEVCSLPSWHGWAQERGWRQKVGGRWGGGKPRSIVCGLACFLCGNQMVPLVGTGRPLAPKCVMFLESLKCRVPGPSPGPRMTCL